MPCHLLCMTLIVKICGLKTIEALDAALDAGADMVGFVFFPKSPRHITPADARVLRQHVRGRAEVVALTVEPDDALVDAILADVEPDWLQLHGRETADRAAALRARGARRIMKAFGVADAADLAAARAYQGIDRLLLDAKPPQKADRPGGNGEAFDWRLLRSGPLPQFLLSGGLTSANVGEAIGRAGAVSGFKGLDVSSGVETAPGIKDPALIEAFIRAARAAPLQRYEERVA